MLPGLVKLYVPVRRFRAMSMEQGNRSASTLTLGVTNQGEVTRVDSMVGGWRAVAPVGDFHDAVVAEQLGDKGAVVEVVADGHAQPA